ncbi:MAG TPA: YceI family protein [Dehalococcoidia bacterium]|nr:YceI family protein [Dehalococcoidia bacterium]
MKRPVIIAGGAVVLAAVAVAVVAGVWLLRSDDPNLLTEAPAIPTSGPAGADVSPTTAAVSTLPAGVRRFVVASGESSAKYVVDETLRGLPATAVGTTTDVTGEIYLTKDGLFKDLPSKFKVDLRTLKTDESMRDNFVRQNVLRTGEFPFAEFVVESVTGFPGSYAEGAEISLTLKGTMTIKGKANPMTFTVKARQAGNTLTATADTQFNMTDFGIEPPEVVLAKAKDGVILQVVLIAREA